MNDVSPKNSIPLSKNSVQATDEDKKIVRCGFKVKEGAKKCVSPSFVLFCYNDNNVI